MCDKQLVVAAMITRAEIDHAFARMIKALRCPACEVEFSDFAIEWGRAWQEGRMDLMDEQGTEERDGPFKLKCELCGHRSWLDYFAKSVRSAEVPRAKNKEPRLVALRSKPR